MQGTLDRSANAVYVAILMNMFCVLAKVAAFVYTGSGSVLSEALHSIADLANQMLLAIGIMRSKRGPTETHPHGHAAERFVWALISAVGLFFCGAAASVYHGITILVTPHELEALHLALWVLGTSMILEGISLAAAIRAIQLCTLA
jgi:zinc transporter 9